MTYTTKWHLNHQKNWSRILAPLIGKPVQALEIGSFEGRSAVWTLENILTHPDSTLVCIDPHKYEETGLGVPSVAERLDRAAELFKKNTAPFADKLTHISEPSASAIQKLDQQFDMIYIDGAHGAAAVLVDSCLCWTKLKVGGYMIWDDYLWGVKNKPAYTKPKIAIDGFGACFRPFLEILEIGKQVIVRKVK